MPSLSLGFSPASGNDSVTQCLFFKALLREKIGRDPDGAYLKTVVEGRRRGMEVEYDPEEKGAQSWAKRAEESAEWCWGEVVNQRARRTGRGA